MASVRALDFDEYFRQQYPQLVAELDYILGDTDLARDVAQDAFIRQYVSWVRLSRYDKPGAWVRKVALRMAFRVRKNQFRNAPLEYATDTEIRPVDSARVLDVRNAVLRLPETQRAAIILFYFRDLPVAEVATALGCKEATVKVHLHQARKRLAELLISYEP
jgi:RNA polymerase sigma factor (sigma-70 family)